MLGAWKEKLNGAIKKLSGRTDFLEAVCAACALVASADNEITDDEIKMTTKVITNNPTLAAAFKSTQIEKCADTMLKRAQGGRSGRFGLYKEIDDVAADSSVGEMVYLAALDVAESDGNVAASEKKVLSEIAKRLSVNEAAMQV